MKPNICSVSMPSARAPERSSAERHRIAAGNIVARTGIQIPKGHRVNEDGVSAASLSQGFGPRREIEAPDPGVRAARTRREVDAIGAGLFAYSDLRGTLSRR